MVHQLEQRLGTKLIDRSRRPFALTPEGQVYYDGCRKLVRGYYALEEEVRTLHEAVAGRVNVASIYSVGLSHMNRCIREFLTLHGQANVRLQYQHPRKVYELVESDQVDLGLVSYAKSSRTLKATPWRDEPMVLVCAPQHPLAERPSIRLADLHGADLISFDRDLQIRREVDRTLAAARVEVQVVMEFDNIETIKRAIEIDAGVSLLPEPTVAGEVSAGSLVAVPLVGSVMVRPLSILHRRGKQLGKTARRFVELLHQWAGSSLEISDQVGAAVPSPPEVAVPSPPKAAVPSPPEIAITAERSENGPLISNRTSGVHTSTGN